MQELNEKYKEKGVEVIGLITEDDVETAKTILSKQGADYKNIIVVGSMNDFLSQFAYIPATMFVNSKGEIVGDYITGGKTLDEFSEIVDGLLK